jgi:hypothetical protein
VARPRHKPAPAAQLLCDAAEGARGAEGRASYRLAQTAYWDFDYFLESYRAQAAALKDVAGAVGAGYVDAQTAVDRAGPVAVFTSPYHFTFRGARLLALAIVPEVERQLGLKPKE